MKYLRYITWLLRALLFLALLLFAARNTDPVVLRFYLDQTWQAPLVLIIVVFFALGAAFGVIACWGKLFGQRREIAALKKELKGKRTDEAPVVPTDSGI